MAQLTQGRESAARVGKWLVDKGRADEAVAVFAAWAANGPNDAEGQTLLAEALRVDPSSRLAKLAFERMEGVTGDHAPLETAMARWSADELEKVEREIVKPAFLRAQVGFNNNVKYKERTFHIQTEDSGLGKPHVITHLFADGGRVIKSHKRSYAEHVRRSDVAPFVRQLMKGQQLEMALMLREGRFDDIVDGRRIGGIEVLEHPPRTEVRRLATQKTARVQALPDGEVSAAPPIPPSSRLNARWPYRLKVVRSRGHGPVEYLLEGDEVIIGTQGSVSLPGETFCHPREAAVRLRAGRLWLHDFEAGNGVFLRIKGSVEVETGDELVVGDQLLRIERNPVPKDAPGPGPTYFYSSPKWLSSFRVVQLFEGGARGACVLARGTTLQIGSKRGDFVFPGDSLVSDQHCVIEEQAGAVLLTDLGAQTGVFVRIKGEQELVEGDELLVGRTRLSVQRA